jgi:hypothetical protein
MCVWAAVAAADGLVLAYIMLSACAYVTYERVGWEGLIRLACSFNFNMKVHLQVGGYSGGP